MLSCEVSVMVAPNTMSPLLWALVNTPGAACEKKSVPSTPLRSMPSLCWSLKVSVSAMARRPMAFCEVLSVSLRKAISPPMEPPLNTLSASSVAVPLMPTSDSAVRVGSAAERPALSDIAWSPSTSDWPLPMKTLYLPPSCSSTFTSTSLPSSLTSWSRWSSRSLGGWPPATALIWPIWWLRVAICLA